MEDRLLVLLCKRGCGKSLTRTYEKYRRDMLFLAMALLNDTAMAEDVAYDVFAQIFADYFRRVQICVHLRNLRINSFFIYI